MTPSIDSSWMFASTAVALLLACAAVVVERVAALRRGVPLRWVWVAAIAATLVLSLTWLRPAAASRAAFGSRAPVGEAAPSGASAARRAIGPARPAYVPSTADELLVAFKRARAVVRAPRFPMIVEFGIRRAWIVGSTAMFALLLFSAVRLRRERRDWHAGTVLDADVLVSDDFGPAIVGIVRPSIVVPAWVLTLDSAAQRTIVVHEEEHRRAGDPRLLLAALIALVAMPWNVGLWLMWRRLQRAVELDCDERVLARGVRDGDYANVLLGAWQRARGSAAWLPSPAFAERASGLGKRVEHLMRPEPRRRVMKTLTGSVVAAGLVALALMVPVPQGAQGAQGTVQAARSDALPLLLIDGVKRRDLDDVAKREAAVKELMNVRHDTIAQGQVVDSANAVRLFGPDGVHGAHALWTKRYLANGGAMLPSNVVTSSVAPRAAAGTTVEQFAAAMYANLFRDISLSPADEAKARAIILDYQKAQHALSGPYLVIWPKRLALDTIRDDRVHALLTNAADRARYDAKVDQGPPRRVQSPREYANNVAFNFISQVPVTAAERERILDVLERSVIAEKEHFERAPLDTAGLVAIVGRRAADVRALLGTDAEREAFDKRQAELKRMLSRPPVPPPPAR